MLGLTVYRIFNPLEAVCRLLTLGEPLMDVEFSSESQILSRLTFTHHLIDFWNRFVAFNL